MKRNKFFTIGFALILSLLFPMVALPAPIRQSAQSGLIPVSAPGFASMKSNRAGTVDLGIGRG